MKFCKATGRITSNPTLEVKAKAALKTDGFKAWDECHVEQFRAAHPLGTMQRLALEILLNTGLRRIDAVRLGRLHLKAGRHEIKPTKTEKKTNMTVKIKMHPNLQAALDAMPPRTVKPGTPTALTYLVSPQGKRFTPNHFGTWFGKACNAAGLPDVRAHGLRKLITIRLVHLGMTPHQIGAVIGDKDLRVIIGYCEQFDREREADKAMAALAAAQ